ncbi:Beta-propeller domains of methanol dehydrogenase type [Olavius algarvensis spirochete endosymbiont]|uniref:TPM domain-containing protein n=1 Tax=Olavius algarvensis spirochete endosymbiont TaxID=260710 RepID=UPI00068CA9FA|nr:TPM domain-containing protein [Olavius algarvensis spirochete endosymbiont]VDA99242.1 Beta-propeller domains of methanol dehydrogenase type [Olavius algarvensis spirochete endosymbiont]
MGLLSAKKQQNSRKWRVGMERIVVILILLGTSVSALEIAPLRGRINDNAGLLSQASKNELEAYLAELERASGIQVALLTIPSLSGENIESYSFRVAEEWGLGDKEDDNGVLLLVALDERKIRIEVGYGLESVLTDAKSGFIIRNVIVPEFKKGNYSEGIVEGLLTIGEVVSGNLTITDDQIENSRSNDGGGMLIFVLIFLLVFFIGFIGRRSRYRRRGMSPLGAFFVGSMLGSAFRSGSASRGFGGGGGFSGGGFSGGGGGFGGGGASGGW